MTFLSRKTALVLLALSLTAPMAHAEGSAVDAATDAKVRSELTTQGYDVRKVTSEDGMIEVYAVKDGATVVLTLDAALKIVKIGE